MDELDLNIQKIFNSHPYKMPLNYTDTINKTLDDLYLNNKNMKKQSFKFFNNQVKTLVASLAIVFFLTGSTVFAKEIITFLKNNGSFIGIGKQHQSLINNGYVVKPNEEPIKNTVSVTTNTSSSENNITIYLDQFIMTNKKINFKYDIHLDDTSADTLNLNNFYLEDNSFNYEQFGSMELDNLIVTDELNNCLSDNKTINTEIVNVDPTNKTISIMITIISKDNFPSSKELNISFSKIIYKKKQSISEDMCFSSNWSFHLDVPEHMYNRTMLSYIVTHSNHEDFIIKKAELSEDGLETTILVKNIQEPIYPERLEHLKQEYYKNNPDGGFAYKEACLTDEGKKLWEDYYSNLYFMNSSARYAYIPSFRKDLKPNIITTNNEEFSTHTVISTFNKDDTATIDITFPITTFEATNSLTMTLYYKDEPIIFELVKNDI